MIDNKYVKYVKKQFVNHGLNFCLKHFKKSNCEEATVLTCAVQRCLLKIAC